MIPVLRPDQQDAKRQVKEAWAAGYKNVMLKMDTGTGKTVTFSDIVREHQGWSLILVHRNHLVAQISLAIARYGVRHRIVASREAIKAIVNAHMVEFKRDFTDPRARVVVASVDTLKGLKPADREWLKHVTLFVPDEAHHVTRENKWGDAYKMLPNPDLLSLMVTATPGRADGKGLGRHADGIADILIFGTTLQQMIDWGYRSPFTIYTPPTVIDTSGIDVSATTGDFNAEQVRQEVHDKSARLVGDVVEHYLKLTPGRVGATFAVDVEEAGKLAAAFRQRGVTAEVITALTPLTTRSMIMRRLERREILQIVSVDILGEGTDVPALEVVSFARPTASYNVYSQQAGRCRGIGGEAFILDHVGNVIRHGVPTAPRTWSLDRRERRGTDDAIPLTRCLECLKPYERHRSACPHCNKPPRVVPVGRSELKQVDGDLVLLIPEEREAMEQERDDAIAAPVVNQRMPEAGQVAAAARHRHRQAAQRELRHTMAVWIGWQNHVGVSTRDAHRLFFIRYQIDTLTAQALYADEANALNERVKAELSRNNVEELTT